MKPRLLLLGGGGHAKVIADILESSGAIELAGFVSVEEQPEELLGYPRLGGDADLPRLLDGGIRLAFPAIGDNRRRGLAIAELQRIGFEIANAVSVDAIVSRHATLAHGIAIMPGAVVNAGTRIGPGAIVNTNASVDHDCEIGECAHIAPGVSLAGAVRIGAGAFVGVGASVIQCIRIGEGTVVGAGAVVVSDLPAGVVAMGVPAIVRR